MSKEATGDEENVVDKTAFPKTPVSYKNLGISTICDKVSKESIRSKEIVDQLPKERLCWEEKGLSEVLACTYNEIATPEESHKREKIDRKGCIKGASLKIEREYTEDNSVSEESLVLEERAHVIKYVLLETFKNLFRPILYGKMQNKPFKTLSELDKYAKNVLTLRIINYKYGIEVENKDIKLLKPNRWLNDKIINIYFEMLQEYSKGVGKRVYVFSTYFYTRLEKGYRFVKKWVEDIRLFEYELIFIPVHLLNHWIFICFDVRNRTLEYFDSLGGHKGCVSFRIMLFFFKGALQILQGKFSCEN